MSEDPPAPAPAAPAAPAAAPATPAQRAFVDSVPHNRALGIEVVAMEQDGAVFRLPYRDDLVGNPDTGVLHGGAITALLDACSGAAVFASLPRMMPIATLDLRIDYLRPAEPGREVHAHATCYKLTRNVAFTRAVAYHDDREDPIASSVGTFMLSTRRGPAKPGSQP
jgi:uncharacterized protein (TIGR00369 family)